VNAVPTAPALTPVAPLAPTGDQPVSTAGRGDPGDLGVRLERRRQELRRELETGERALADLTERQAHLRDQLLRIGGALRLLDEELGARSPS
jgi:hypothetical protein